MGTHPGAQESELQGRPLLSPALHAARHTCHLKRRLAVLPRVTWWPQPGLGADLGPDGEHFWSSGWSRPPPTPSPSPRPVLTGGPNLCKEVPMFIR